MNRYGVKEQPIKSASIFLPLKNDYLAWQDERGNRDMLSKKTQYAFKALMYLAQKPNNEPVLIAEISQNRNIPLKFLENILLELKKDGILESKKGKGGGYYLAKEPEKIVLADVMRLIEGPIALLPCVSLHFYKQCGQCDENHCGLHRIMIQVRDANLAILENKTVADISYSSVPVDADCSAI